MMKHFKISFLILVLLGVVLNTNIFAQDCDLTDFRVDSVFKSYFDFLTRDISEIDTTDYVILVKDIEMTILIFDFLENISGHFQQRQLLNENYYPKDGKSWYCYSSNNGFSKVCVIYTEEDLEYWKNWYINNKTLLTWIQDDKKISSKSPIEFNYIDYNQIYPSKIRFKGKADWVPIADKPEQVKDLEKQMNKSGLLKPKDGRIK